MQEYRLAKLISGGAAVLMATGIAVVAAMQDRHQRGLITGGHCERVMEALYTPPPIATTYCYGEGSGPPCSTFYSQPDPYLRTLWRCKAEGGRAPEEFWRRSAEASE